MEWRNRKTHWYEAVGSALTFPFLKEVSRNCFVFDVESRRIAALLMLSSSKIEEVSQKSFVFKLADRQTGRQADRQTDREIERDRERDR